MDFKNHVVGIDKKVPLYNGSLVTAINFDNAATTPPLKSVLKEVVNFSPWYSSIHRGTGFKSRYSSRLYEESREIIGQFVNANLTKNTIVFVKNATEAINKLSYRLYENNEKDVILSTTMEHHSNDLPWRNKFKVDYVEIDGNGRLDLEDLETKLKKYKGSVKLVAVTGASNVTGYLNPIHRIASLAHTYGAKILVDAAQLVPHVPVNMNPKKHQEAIDYLVFSAHKMYAPFGIGVLIGPKDTFIKGNPDYSGGGTVDIVTHDYVKWTEPPHKEEAGSPNLIGVIALAAAIRTLKDLGMENIYQHEKRLTGYAIENLKSIPHIEMYGDIKDYDDRVGIITFNIKGIHHETLANILSYEGGIAVRNGCFCAHPYIHRLLKVEQEVIDRRIEDPSLPHPGMVRLSLGLYNTSREIDVFIDCLKTIVENKNHFIQKYSSRRYR